MLHGYWYPTMDNLSIRITRELEKIRPISTFVPLIILPISSIWLMLFMSYFTWYPFCNWTINTLDNFTGCKPCGLCTQCIFLMTSLLSSTQCLHQSTKTVEVFLCSLVCYLTCIDFTLSRWGRVVKNTNINRKINAKEDLSSGIIIRFPRPPSID